MYKLGKQLFEYPGAKRIADMVRNKVEKFKVLLPVLCAICNKVCTYIDILISMSVELMTPIRFYKFDEFACLGIVTLKGMNRI